jgi:hypothetical protein
MGIDVAVGGSHRLVVLTGVIAVNIAMRLSLHRDNDAAKNLAALPDGVKDNPQRRRRPPRFHARAQVSVEGATIAVNTDRNGNATSTFLPTKCRRSNRSRRRG